MAAKNLITLAVLLFLFAVISASAQVTSVPFEMTHSFITVKATVHGTEGTFILDTGATRTIVSPRISGLSPSQIASSAHTRVHNSLLASDKDIPLATVRIRIGNTIFSDALVWVAEVKDCDGIIGLDLLSRFQSFTVDYKTKSLILAD